MIKHILFDFDGTLADSADIAVHVYNDLAEKYHFKKMTKDELLETTNFPIKERFKMVGAPFYKLPQLTIDALLRYRQLIHSLEPFKGMHELTEALKAEELGLSILSSNSVENIEDFLKKYELELFDNLFSVINIFGKHKSIKKFLKQFNLKPDEVIYIGDELRDVEACKKVGVKIISVTWGYDSLSLLQGGNPDFIAHKPEDILEIVKNIKNQ